MACAGCFPSADVRHPQSVMAALADHPMRTMEGEHIAVYYPEGREEEARTFLPYVEGCAAYLKEAARIHNRYSAQKMTVLLPELPYNNAYVAPRIAGYDSIAVVPTFNTAALFTLEMGQPPDPAAIACHEIVHYVHFQQFAGFSWFLNLFGSVYSPQIGLDGWFAEGLAVYYETKLQPGIGRLSWPVWRGAFAAGYAGRRISGGDLSDFQRDFYLGNHYLVGSHFIRFLAERYGEDKLWDLIAVQGRSIFSPLFVNVRFWQVYDKSLSTLIDEFADSVRSDIAVRARPKDQSTLKTAGTAARYARANDGSEALVTADHDSPTRLLVFHPDGRQRWDLNLAEVVPPRRLLSASPAMISGLSFSADARALYFVAVDRSVVYSTARLIRFDVESGSLSVLRDDLKGIGGSVSPDGTRYAFAQATGDHHDLAELNLSTGTVRVLNAENHGGYVSEPRYSPDGTRLLASRFDGASFRIALFDAASGRPIQTVATVNGPVQDPAWIDDRNIAYLATNDQNAAVGRDIGFQVYQNDLVTGANTRLTNAPYLAFQPRVVGRSLRFLNREGWHWTVDEVALPVVAAKAATASETTSERGTPSTTTMPTTTADTANIPPPVAFPATDAVDATNPTNPTNPTLPATGSPVEAAAPPQQAETPPADQEAQRPPTPRQPPPPWNVPQPTADPNAPIVAQMRATDRPYSAFDHLFVPRLLGPTFTAVGRDGNLFGLVASGNDRLSRHRWTIAGYYQFAGGGSPSVEFGYLNQQLAPWAIRLYATQYRIHDILPVAPGEMAPEFPAHTLLRRDRQADVDLFRYFYGTPVDFGFTMLETYRPGDPAVWVERRRMAGPHISAEYMGYEATEYTDVRRLLAIGGHAAVYPGDWNTLGVGVTDLRGEIDVSTPLPLARRHILDLSVRGRELIGAPSNNPLMSLGGFQSVFNKRWSKHPEFPLYESRDLPPGMAFAEGLRGFEDHAMYTNRALIANAGYRYPIIVDWGSASTLGLLPAFFLRQFDIELFASGALTQNTLSLISGLGWQPTVGKHVAVGASLALECALWIVPATVQYQIARRTTDDQAVVHLIMVGI